MSPNDFGSGGRLTLVTEVLRSFADATTDYARLLQTVADRIGEVTGHACSIRLLSAQGDQLETAAHHDPHQDPTFAQLAGVPIPITAALAAALTQQRAYVEELASQRGIEEAHRGRGGAPRVTRVLVAPLVARSAPLGFLFVVQRASDAAPFTAEDVALVDALARHAALALANARLLASVESLERARAHERSILDSVMAPLVVLGADCRIVTVNRAFAQIFEVDGEAVSGQVIYDIASRAFDTPIVRALFAELPPTERLREELDVPLETPTGRRVFMVRLNKTFRPGNGSETTLVTLIDRTERIAAAMLTHRRSLLISSMSEALVGLDRHFNVEEWNPAAERLFGWTADEVRGKPISQFFAITANNDREAHRQNLRAGRTVRARIRIKNRAGVWVDVEFSTMPVMDAARGEKEPTGYVCVMLDVTERVRLEAELSARVDALTTANKELESFSYSVSHDLRAPVRAIDGFAELLEEEHATGLDEEGKRLLAIVRKNARRMGLLIDDLLALARYSRQPIVEEDVDMDALARATLDEVMRLEPDRKIAVSFGSLPSVRGDETLLRQVWVNLYSNAVKYTRGRAEAAIETSASEENGEVFYKVKDNGAGFDMRHAGKLFGTFERLHTAKEFEGTGIGLALVARIVDRHGGQVWGTGEVGKGASFVFSLPKARKEIS